MRQPSRPTGPGSPMAAAERGVAMRKALLALQRQFPGLGITLFVFDFGTQGGMLYGSNARREDMLRAIDKWRTEIVGS